MYPSTNVLWKPNNERKKEKRINSTKLQVSEHKIEVYSTLSGCIHTEMINLRLGAWALPLNPIVWRKRDHVYHFRTTFSPSAINRYFMLACPRIKIFYEGLSPGYRHFSGGFFQDTERLSRSWLLPELLFLSLFLSFIQ